MLITENYLRKIIKSELIKESKNTLFHSNIRDIDSSTAFRTWVNKNKSKEEIAKLFQGMNDDSLDNKATKKTFKNSYVKKAWKSFGKEYVMGSDAAQKEKEPTAKKKTGLAVKGRYKPGQGIPDNYLKVQLGGITYGIVDKGDGEVDAYGRKPGSGSKYEKLAESTAIREEKVGRSDLLSKRAFLRQVKSVIEKNPRIKKQIDKISPNTSLSISRPKASKKIKIEDIDLSPFKVESSIVSRAKDLGKEIGIDPAFVYAEEKKESASDARAMAWNIHIMRNPKFYKDKSQVLTQEQQNQLTKLGFPKKKSYYEGDAKRAFQKAWQVSPYGAIVAGAWGLYQVLGSFALEAYDNDPMAWADEFSNDPVEYSKTAFKTWISQPGYGQKFIDAANEGNYKYTTSKYFGSSTSSMGKEYMEKIGNYVKQYRKKYGKS
tara:strand:+ start:3198 stop:4493 length:1296 start_codon:yes stop_codon:yes gene_type:complete